MCNSRIEEIILIDYNTNLLDYEHQFMGSLHAMDSKSRIELHLVLIYIRYWSAIDSL